MTIKASKSIAAGLLPICTVCIVYGIRELILIPNAERGLISSASTWPVLGGTFIASLLFAGGLAETEIGVILIACSTAIFRRGLHAALLWFRLDYFVAPSRDDVVSEIQLVSVEFFLWLLVTWCGSLVALWWSKTHRIPLKM